jgi:peptide/nickel transport system permease protein
MRLPPIAEHGPDSTAPLDAPPPRVGNVRGRGRLMAWRRFWSVFRTSKMGIAGVVILVLFASMALLAPVFSDRDRTDVTKVDGPTLVAPSWQYPLGTDDQGRSVLDLVIWGSRTSLQVGLLAAAVSMIVGALLGILAGYRGGLWDAFLMRFTDWFLVVPWLVLAIVCATIFGQSMLVIVFVIGLTSWPWTARLVRSQTLSVRERPYIERARGLGASDTHLIRKHVFPNVLPVLLAQTILSIALAILSESTLSFIGLGDPARPSWGALLDNAFEAGATTLGAWWWIASPGVCIVLVVLAFTMCGTALEEILNPRLRQR